MNRHTPKKGPKAYTKRWWNMRKKTIGASEAAAVCGLSRWAQPLSIYQRKIDGDVERPQNEAQQMGHVLEPAILNRYQSMVGGTMQGSVPMLIHPRIPYMSATPDALWTDSLVDKASIMDHNYLPVDAKTSRSMAHWGEAGTDDIPQEYILQAQQQMAVTGAERCDLPVLMPTLSVKIFHVARNESIIRQLISAEKELMERIENRDPPEAMWSHPGALELMKELYDVKEEAVELGSLDACIWDDITKWKSQRAELDGLISSHKAKLLKTMKEASKGMLPDGRIIKRKKVSRDETVIPAYEYVIISCAKPKEDEKV